MVGPLPLDQRDRVRDDARGSRVRQSAAPLGEPGSATTSVLRAHADDLPREVGRRKAARGLRAHLLGEPGDLEVDDLAHALGRPVARRDAGAARSAR